MASSIISIVTGGTFLLISFLLPSVLPSHRPPPSVSVLLPQDLEAILRLLEEVRGPVHVQKYLIHHAIKEAAR